MNFQTSITKTVIYLSFTFVFFDIKAQNIPLTKDELFVEGTGDLNPYEYEPRFFPVNLKRREEYLNGQFIGAEAYAKGQKVFSYRYGWSLKNDHDSTVPEIQAWIFNDKKELIKRYDLSNDGISIYTYDRSLPSKIQSFYKSNRDTADGHLAFVKTLKTMDLLLKSEELKAIETNEKGYLIEEYTYNATQQLKKVVEYRDNGTVLFVINFLHSKDGRNVSYNYSSNGVITDSMRIVYQPNCYYKGSKRKKVKEFKQYKISRNTSYDFVSGNTFKHDASCNLVTEETILNNTKVTITYEYDTNGNWITKKSTAMNSTLIDGLYTRKYNDKGLMINMTKRFRSDKKLNLYTYKYEFE